MYQNGNNNNTLLHVELTWSLLYQLYGMTEESEHLPKYGQKTIQNYKMFALTVNLLE
jgi:hypothetical protein